MTAPVATLQTLDEQARVQQATIASKVSQAILAYWLINVSADDISGTSGGWLDFSVAAILRGYEQAYQLAAAYAQAVRNIQIPGATPITIPRPIGPSEEQLRRSLIYTGPGKLAVDLTKVPRINPQDQSLADGERLKRDQQSIAQMREKARQTAGAAAAASAYRNVSSGGRDTVNEMVDKKVAVGYVRITKEHPCAFCLMLASRGPVYGKDSFKESDARFTGSGNAKAHDGCGCSLRPVYKVGEENWPDQARQADELWKEMLRTKKYNEDPAAAFAKLVRERGLADLTRY